MMIAIARFALKMYLGSDTWFKHKTADKCIWKRQKTDL